MESPIKFALARNVRRRAPERHGERTREPLATLTAITVSCSLGIIQLTHGYAQATETAESAESAQSDEIGTFTFQIENDLIANADRNYTSGVRIGWTSPGLRNQLPWVGDALEWIYPFDVNADARVGIHMGQSIYTPEDLSESNLNSDDRPYAGWLYAGVSLHAEAEQTILTLPFDTLDKLELDLGMVGPASLAEQTQKFVHKYTDSPDPKGWSNQLNNEPGVVVLLERNWRSPAHDFEGTGVQADVIPTAGVSLGNVNTSASLGAILRFGQGLNVDYGPPLIQPNLAGVTFIDRVDAGYAWYIFGGFGGTFVARNIFLDGNTFSDSHSVDKKLLVGSATAGLAVVVGGARLALTHVWRTREFDGQKKPDRFGSLSVSVRF